MGVQLRIDKEQNLLRIVMSGSFTTDDILDSLAVVTDSPDLQPPFNVLSDHTGLQEFISPEQVKLMVNYFSRNAERFGGARWAVVTKAKASYGMMRMMGTLLETIPMELQVFATEQEALVWLNSPS